MIWVVLVYAHSSGMAAGDTVIITATEIVELQAHNMADILNSVPGLSAGTSSVSIHGNYKVKVFLDGRPLNDPTSSHGAIKWDLVSPADIEKIEILRGKGGVRYGQDASGGVILITSKESNKLLGNLKTFGGSEDRYFFNSSLQWVKGDWTSTIRGGYETTNGYKINNDKERYQLGGGFGYSLDDSRQLLINADFTSDKRGYSGSPDYPTPFSRAETTTGAYALQFDTESVKSKVYLNKGEKHNTDISKGLDKKIEVDDYGAEVSGVKNSEKYGELSYGTGFYWSVANGTSFTEKDESTTSLFLIDTYSFDKIPGFEKIPVSITLGARVNFNSAFDDAFNPETKVTYTASSWRGTISYSRTNNTPSFYKRYNETSSTRPNPDLNMEVADNFSFAFFSELSDKLNGSFTIFHNKLTDRITYTYGENGTSSYQNVGSASYSGGDISITWQPLDSIKLKGNYTYLEAIDEDTDLDLPAKPRHKGRVDLTYTPVEKFSTIFTGRGVSDAYRNRANTIRIGSYWIYDCKMEYSFAKFRLFAEVKTLLEEEYFYVDGLLAPPRTWFAGIQVRI